MIGQQIGHYRIESQLGEGGMGTVYKALDTRLERYVALKTISKAKALTLERRMRLVREAKATSSLNHPNVVTIYDIIEDQGQIYIAMEFVQGNTLLELVHQHRVSLSDAVRYGIQLAGALTKTHAAGIIHRDLKPTNVMITRDGHVKVLDFGLAKLTEPEPEDTDDTATIGLTKDGVVVGSAGYMSPEQAEGRLVDARSDVFAFGLTMYETVTGKRAFHKSSTLATLASVLHDPPAPIRELAPECPLELEAIIERCLRKNLNERYQSMEQVAADLEALAAGRTESHAMPMLYRERGSAIAVLPFANLSADPDADYFSDGLAEEIITALSKMRTLRITARTSAFRFRSKDLDLREIGEKLKVDYILLGTVRRAGTRVRITVELVNPADECQLWSDRYDRTMDDIFSIQDDISRAVVEALKNHIPGLSESLGRVMDRRRDELPPKNVEAHEDFLRGRYCLARRSWDSLRRAIDFFNSTLAKDPTAALAKVGLADCYNLLGYYNERPPHEVFPKAKAAAAEAIQITPRLGEAHASLGYAIVFYDWNWAEAEHEFQRAARLAPGYATARHWRTWLYFARGEFEKALNCIREAHQADPLAPILNSHMGLAMAYAGQTDQAIRHLVSTIDLDPGFFLAHYHLGTVYCLDGKMDKAIAALDTADRLSYGTLGAGLLSCAYAMGGRPEEARRILHRMELSSGYVAPLELAYAHAGLGETEEAFRLLALAVEHRNSDLVRLRIQPWPNTMKEDPRFEALAAQIGLPKIGFTNF